MTDAKSFPKGGYRYAKGVFQYSAGVAAEPGFEIVRARFLKPVPLEEGFARIKNHLESAGRPLTAFAACELRSPKPFDEQGFLAFNKRYVEPLHAWGLIEGDENPVARSNVCPIADPPSEPSFHAFSYTIPSTRKEGTFIVAGGAEAPEGTASYEQHTVRLRDRSPDAIREKAQWVLAEAERRMASLGFGWNDCTATQLYTAYNVHHILEDEIWRRGAASAGLTWQYCRPPVDVLDYEMDMRGVSVEYVLS
ncbi:hypothetical protein JP75_18645 [Devosia riboflavina]|uniref:RidA family protein n=1 Tax=Devosia riboflavina TaxID=46914 RepID=A0A087LYW7_9HYPH|nr:hypothetical protein [Devosia riboflavina]KFL29820.1 hypothetical protein JP75_18645 [Devosia riboflavina]